MIGERLMVHPTSVTNIIGRLERQKMVTRRPNPADGRGTLAEITDAGRAVVKQATADLMAAEFGLGGFAEAQLKEIFDLFRELRLTAGDFIPEPAAAPAAAAPAAAAPAVPAAAPAAAAPAVPAAAPAVPAVAPAVPGVAESPQQPGPREALHSWGSGLLGAIDG